VLQLAEQVDDLPAVVRVGDPACRVDLRQVERCRDAAQGLGATGVHVLVEIRHREFAQGAVDRIAPADPEMVALGQRAPAAVAAEHRDDMVVVVAFGMQVEQQRRLSVQPQAAGADEGRLDAVGMLLSQHRSDRQHGVSRPFVVA
jgi:hypothetical protein